VQKIGKKKFVATFHATDTFQQLYIILTTMWTLCTDHYIMTTMYKHYCIWILHCVSKTGHCIMPHNSHRNQALWV